MERGPVLQEAWPASNGELETMVAELQPSGFQPGTSEWAVARAWQLLCALDPDHHHAQLAGLVDGLDTLQADQQPWWHTLHATPTPSAATLILTYLTHPTAVAQTHQREERERQAEEDRKRAAQRADERDRLVAERDRLQAKASRLPVGYLSGGAFVGWTILVFVVVNVLESILAGTHLIIHSPANNNWLHWELGNIPISIGIGTVIAIIWAMRVRSGDLIRRKLAEVDRQLERRG
jgi:hypothetical protein